ncbi:MAG TPA: histidinol dehydrogenase [Candidatus Acidoferrales bacterium]|jgi:histidinol dehydrogenase
MRILDLTDGVARKILAARTRSDVAAERVAAPIIASVRRGGDAALFRWARRLDGARLTPRTLWVSAADRRAALQTVPRELRAAIEHAARNIRRVAEQQQPRPWSITVEPGVRVGQRVTPLDTIGCYIPGGRFSLVSTLLMTAVPAQVAGVRRIVVACPKANPALLAAADLLDVTEIARIGGAQAVAALAYGTRSVPRVDKIFGPGNRYVTAAKRLVSADCAIDLLAGPTEVLVVATRGNARYIAADLVAQAEHDGDAVALLVTTSRALARDVRESVAEQLSVLPPSNPAWKSLAATGAILVARSLPAAVRFANQFAPEHMSIPGGEAAVLRQLSVAGSVFVGPWSAQSIGDYASGTNHVLPTGGGAHSRGGLSAWDFVRCTSVQQLSQSGLRRLAPIVAALADAEGLTAHRRAVEVRE